MDYPRRQLGKEKEREIQNDRYEVNIFIQNVDFLPLQNEFASQGFHIETEKE